MSPEKEELLKPLIKQFNDERNGRLRATKMSKAQKKLGRHRERGSSAAQSSRTCGRRRLVLGSARRTCEADKRYVADENESIVRTAGDRDVGADGARARLAAQADLLRRHRSGSTSAPNGWASVGKPEFGASRYVHTERRLLDLGRRGGRRLLLRGGQRREKGLTEADVKSGGREKVKELERAIVHYGDSTLFIEDSSARAARLRARRRRWRKTTVIDFNDRRCQNTRASSALRGGGLVRQRLDVHGPRCAVGDGAKRRRAAKTDSGSWRRR